MNVKELRTKLNLTQHELATITGIPRDRIAKWEQGKGTPKGYDNQVLINLQKTADSIIDLREEIAETSRIIPAVRYGIALKKKREGAGLTWEELGNQLDIVPIMIQCAERGLMGVEMPELQKLWEWAGIDAREMQKAMDEQQANLSKAISSSKGDGHDPEYISLLKSNDAFFKNQYTAFNAQVLANLTALMNAQKEMLQHQKNLEALVKISLEHTGNVEALQRGVEPAEVHDEINRDILSAAGVENDNAVGSPGKG